MRFYRSICLLLGQIEARRCGARCRGVTRRMPAARTSAGAGAGGWSMARAGAEAHGAFLLKSLVINLLFVSIYYSKWGSSAVKIYVFYPDVHLSRIFLLIRANLESQIPLGSLTFPTVENPWRNNLNNYLVIYGGFSILGVPPLASKLSLNFLFLTQSCFKNLLQACYFFTLQYILFMIITQPVG